MVGRLSSILLAGPALDAEEISLMCWLKSPLLLGGMDDDVSLFSDADIFLSAETHASGSESYEGVEVDADVVRVKKIQRKVDGKGEETEKELETEMGEEVGEKKKDVENGTRHIKSVQTDKASPNPELQTVIGSLTRLESSGVDPEAIEEEGKEEEEKKKGREKELEQHRDSSTEVLPNLRHGELNGESGIDVGISRKGGKCEEIFPIESLINRISNKYHLEILGFILKHINAFYLLDLTYIFIPKEAQKDVSFINDAKYTVHCDYKAGMTYLVLCLALVA